MMQLKNKKEWRNPDQEKQMLYVFAICGYRLKESRE